MADDGASYESRSPDLSTFNAPGPTTAPPMSLQQNLHADHDQLPQHYEQQQQLLSTAYPLPVSDHSFQYYEAPSSHYQPSNVILSTAEPKYFPPQAQHQLQTTHHHPDPQHTPAWPLYGSVPYLASTFQNPILGGYSACSVSQGPSWPPYSYGQEKPAIYRYPGEKLEPEIEIKPEHRDLIDMPPRRAAAVAAAAANSAAALESTPPAELIPFETSPVKTKFPTARIKRIMQADEEVGKVAQQTPIAVGKALELFMVQLVSKSAEIAREKGSKKVSANMLKQVVEMDDQWDFLREIVGRVEVEKEGGKAKAKADSDTEEDEPKKRSRGGRKKKSVDL